MTPAVRIRHRESSQHGDRTVRARLMSGLAPVPAPVWQPLSRVVGTVLAHHPVTGVRQWQLNAQAMTGAIPSSRCTARAVDSWIRTLMTSMQLPRWSTDHI
ncbi:MAG: hypothetical protein R5N60_06395, partial [Cutibacterium granulosum]|nr:hypothetical protein [Cutibacterium granulosum]